MHIKTIKIRNPKAVLVQIPGFITEKWNLQPDDGVEVHISDDEQTITLKPRKGFIRVLARAMASEVTVTDSMTSND
jgi:hypothetical protein